ncbi:MAG: DUF1549 and DUF1553 domain-containing protein [Pirellulales bacterium]
MATDQEQPDDPLDADVAWMLKSTAGIPTPRAEFVRALSDRLDAEFVAEFSAIGQRPSLVERLQSPSTNGNGKAHHAETNGHVKHKPSPVVAPPVGRRWQRWSMSAAAAASLLAAFVVWGPAYGWTEAIRAWVVGAVQFADGDGSTAPAAPSQISEQNEPAVPVNLAEAATLRAEAPQQLEAQKITDVQVIASPPKEESDPSEKKAYDKPEPPPAKAAPPWAPFDEPLPEDELSQRVDEQLAAVWQAQGIRTAAPASDVEFMRRVYLDLTGRIPSVSEVHEFLENKSPSRREQLVDRLLAHHDHATHLAAVWRSMLVPEGTDPTRAADPIKFEEWLTERFAVNKPYDQIVRELLNVEGRVSESGPLLFYAAARLNPEELAGKTSRAFLGVRMECAQCHDHPFDEVSQQDFWSFAALFARISRPKGKMEITSPVLQVRDSKQGDVMIPQSDKVVAPRLPLGGADIDDGPDGPSRRQQLADWLTSRTNGQFARATVNRVWAHLFGRGLVEPVDDMRPANKPLAPEVLDTLSRDFAASGFDLRRLFRALVLTKTYQLSSRSSDNDPSRALHFAQMNIKSFTAEQLYDCITIATRRAAAAAPAGAPEGAGLERFRDTNRQAFIEQFRAPPGQSTDYHAGIPQALTLMHGGLIHSATDLASSGLLKSLSAPFFDNERRLKTMFLSTLSRYPEPAELDVMLKQLNTAKSPAEKQQVQGDVLWALLNSGEFTFNH